MIGIFDSGLGGLSVVRRIREQLPHHELLFFADQAHVPYGERSEADLVQLLAHNVSWLDEQGVEAIVMGCNTSCAIAGKFGWPHARAPIVNLVESAAIAVKEAGFQRVAVIATTATVRSHAYAGALQTRTLEVAAPALVPLVEAGKAGTQEAHEAVAQICAQLPDDLDALIYGCTHYPLLDAHFAQVLSERVARLDPAIEHARRAAAIASAAPQTLGLGTTTYVTNGDLERFRTSVRMLTGEFDPSVRAITSTLMKQT